MRKQREMFCSFCGKSQHDVKKLIAGPKVFICDECVEICIETLGHDREWCDREIVNLKRLRQQARDVDPIPRHRCRTTTIGAPAGSAG